MVCMWGLDTLSYSLENTHITNWESTLLGHQVELEWKLKVFSSFSNLWFWISLHQSTLFCSYILKLTKHMLSITNEVDPLIFCYVCFVCNTNMYFSNIRILHYPHNTSLWLWRWKGMCPGMTTKGHKGIRIPLKLS